MPVRQIIYASALAGNQEVSCVDEILRVSVANNARQHVTGMLLYINGSFLQLLEGDQRTLDRLYESILADPRHTGAVKILDIKVEERLLPDWSMGHAALTGRELDQLSGKNDFFSKGHCLTELDEGIVRRVLSEFRDGMWRRRIN